MITDNGRFKLGAVQAAAIPIDREASTKEACRLIGEAAAKGVTIVAGFVAGTDFATVDGDVTAGGVPCPRPP